MTKRVKFQRRWIETGGWGGARFEAPSLIAPSYLIPPEPPCLAELERIQVQGAAKMNPGKKKNKKQKPLIRHKPTLKSRMHLIEEAAVYLFFFFFNSLTPFSCAGARDPPPCSERPCASLRVFARRLRNSDASYSGSEAWRRLI